MAQLNFGLLGLNQPSIADRFLAGQDQQQQNALREMQITAQADERHARIADRESIVMQRKAGEAEAARRQQWMGTFADSLAKGGHKLTPETMTMMISSNIPEVQQLGLKGMQELESERRYQEAMAGGAPSAAPAGVSPAGVSPAGAAPAGVAPVVFDPSRAQAQINALSQLRDPRAMQTVNALQSQIREHNREQDRVRDDKRQRDRDEQATLDRAEARLLRQTIASNKGGGSGGEGGASGAGEAGKGTMTVRDENGKTTTVTKADAVRRGLVEIKNDSQMTPQEIQKREANYPKAKRAVDTVEAGMDTLATDLRDLANHEGLSGITGTVFGRTPSALPSSLAAQRLYDKVLARGQFSELVNLKSAGGTLGPVTNTEGQWLRQSFAEIGQAQSTKAMQIALRRAADNAEIVKQRAREEYENTYEYRDKPGVGKGVDTTNPLIKYKIPPK